MNYFRSELYRTTKMKSLYSLSIIFLTTLTLFTLIFTSPDPEVPPFTLDEYTTFLFYFTMFNSLFLCMILVSIIGGKQLDILKQTISYGISKANIYIVKFFISISILLLLFILLEVIFSIIEVLTFTNEPYQTVVFGIKFLNTIPMIISVFAFCQWLNFRRINGVVTVLAVFGVYFVSYDNAIDELIFKKQVISPCTPSSLLYEALNSNKFEPRVFFTGIFLSILFFVVGYYRFNKKDVA